MQETHWNFSDAQEVSLTSVRECNSVTNKRNPPDQRLASVQEQRTCVEPPPTEEIPRSASDYTANSNKVGDGCEGFRFSQLFLPKLSNKNQNWASLKTKLNDCSPKKTLKSFENLFVIMNHPTLEFSIRHMICPWRPVYRIPLSCDKNLMRFFPMILYRGLSKFRCLISSVFSLFFSFSKQKWNLKPKHARGMQSFVWLADELSFCGCTVCSFCVFNQ